MKYKSILMHITTTLTMAIAIFAIPMSVSYAQVSTQENCYFWAAGEFLGKQNHVRVFFDVITVPRESAKKVSSRWTSNFIADNESRFHVRNLGLNSIYQHCDKSKDEVEKIRSHDISETIKFLKGPNYKGIRMDILEAHGDWTLK